MEIKTNGTSYGDKFDLDYLQYFKDTPASFKNCKNPDFTKVIFYYYKCSFN